jgi:hypothetical protein
VGPEKRVDRRQDLIWDAQIMGLDGIAVGDCQLLNVSESGAKLIPQGDAQVPDQFVLTLAKDGSVQRQCKVKWRTKTDIGVQFVRPTVDSKKLRGLQARE